MNVRQFTPWPKQVQMLSSKAEWLLFGGGVGGGKTLALILNFLQYAHIPNFSMVVFRREYSQFKKPGGMWQELKPFLAATDAHVNNTTMTATWPSGAMLACVGLQHESDTEKHQGIAYGQVAWDELTHFTRSQFIYLASRNRSTTGVVSHFRMTCNPDFDSWVRNMVDPYIGPDGLANDKCGKLCWIANDPNHEEGIFVHGWSIGELAEKLDMPRTKEGLLDVYNLYAKTFTFMPSMLVDNPALANNKEYLKSLHMMNPVEKAQLLGGNWNARAEGGNLFDRQKFYTVETVAPSQIVRQVRAWDLAATEATLSKDPDFTVGVKMAELRDGTIVVMDVERFRGNATMVHNRVREVAMADRARCIKEKTPFVDIVIEEEKGGSGKFTSRGFTHRSLKEFDVFVEPAKGDKATRARSLSVAQNNGRLYLFHNGWNASFRQELSAFPSSIVKDDQVDAAAMAFNHLYRYSDVDIAIAPGMVDDDFEVLTSFGPGF